MSNTISADAEGMPKFTSLTEAIAAYHAGNAAFSAHPVVDKVDYTDDEMELAEAQTYGPADAALKVWSRPINGLDEAVAALRVAALESKMYSASDVLTNMLSVALGYFDSRAEEPSLYHLIATYWQRYDDLTKAMEVTDHSVPSMKAAAQEAQFAAGDRLDEAAIAICAFVPTWRVDAQIKSDFIDSLYNRNGTLEDDELRALLTSMPKVYDASAGRRVA